MNIFWIGLLVIILFLLYQYRKLEKNYETLLKINSTKPIDIEKIKKKIHDIESDIKTIKTNLD
tara:strand:+ start:83 stop:271 length:189 start_codon:yes stop_codon:yes gene_type:complete